MFMTATVHGTFVDDRHVLNGLHKRLCAGSIP
jgi:hypothetical protein